MRYLNYRIDAPLPEVMEYNGKKYKLTLYFDRVIRFYDMIKDKKSELSYEDKIEIAYDWLVESPKKAGLTEKLEVVDKINREYLSEHHDRVKKKKERTAVNFIADSKYIYAAFRQFYGINLFEEQGKLLWWEFIAMFDSLPSDCKIKEIMYIRTRKIPEYNGHNHDEIILVKEQQEFYFLDENWEEVEKESSDMLSSLFDSMVRLAKSQ
ncbi:MAG: Gp15 family bacteriophage protein [Ruminiclostridium sp.]